MTVTSCARVSKPLLFAKRILATVSLVAVVFVATPARTMVEGPPGANVGDTPADFEGMAIAVDVGAHTGNATFEYPFEVPPGRNGFQPTLKLVYSHVTRDTDVGFGWELPLGKIERVTQRGVPRYNDVSDTLQVTLPDRRFELVRSGTGWAARVDDVHASVTASPSPALRMVMPSGLIYTFGDTAASRIVRPGSSATTATIFAWYLTRIEDPNGNLIEITYLQEEGYAYPDTVSYGKNPGAGLGHAYDLFLFWLPRTTPEQRRTSCAAGFCRTMGKTLGLIFVGRTGGGLVRGFSLDWQPSTVNHAPLLRGIQVLGSDGATVLTKANGQPASTRFEYHEPTLKTWDGSLPGQIDWEAHDYAPAVTYDEFNTKELPWRDWKPEDPCTNRDFVDINGDGRPDWVRSGPDYDDITNPYWIVRLNQGPAVASLFGPEIAWRAPRKCLAWRQEAYWLYTGYAKWGELNQAIGSVPCNGQTDPEQSLRCSQVTTNGLVDLDGDGRPEYVTTDGQTHWQVYFQNPNGPGFQQQPVLWPVPTPVPSSAMHDRRYRLDFTEHSVLDYNLIEAELRLIITSDVIDASFYETPTSKSWIRIRQRPVHALIDMNADGRPDLVDVGLGASVAEDPSIYNYGGPNKGQVRVYWNRGNGFDATHEVLLGGPPGEPIRAGGTSPGRTFRSSDSANSGKPERNVTVEMFDLNGDGLRDVVKALGTRERCGGQFYQWQVWYGTGISYPNSQVDLPAGAPPSFDGPHCWGGPQNEELREWSKKRGLVDVLDINADGLPDYVNATNFRGSTTPVTNCDAGCDPAEDCDGDPGCCCHTDYPYNPVWRVWINTGSGLEDRGLVFFPKPVRRNELETDDGGAETTTIGLISETFDLDGNGYPDSVQTGNEGHLKINYRHPENLLPNMLVKVTNPLGGTTEIDYAISTQFNTPEVDPDVDPHQYRYHLPFPFWVVQAITRSDPAAGENGKVRTRWDYRGGYFNPAERSVVGFRAVDEITVVADPTRPGSLKDGPHEYAEFHQTLGREGRKRLEYVFVNDGYNGLLKHRDFKWDLATRDESSGWRRYFPTLTERLEADASSNPGTHWDSKYCPRLPGCPSVLPPGSLRAKREKLQYDNCGNVTQTIMSDATEGHRTNNPGVDVELRRVDSTFTTAGTCNTSMRTCTGICDRALTRKVLGGLEERFQYERGNQWEAKRIGEGNPTITRLFDAAGNLAAVVDARGMATTIEYDTRHMYPAKWVVDAAGKKHTTRREYDPKFGTVTKHTDPAGAVTEYGYDLFGRLSDVAEPEQTLGAPTRKYRYVIEDYVGVGPIFERSRVEAEFREPTWNLGGAPYRKEVTFYDALGRRLQKQAHREVGGEVRAVVLDAVEYDAAGQVVREFPPAVIGDRELISIVAPPAGPATTITRDEFFREVRRTAPDGSARTTNRRTAWVMEECDALNTSNPARGQCVAKEVDALERLRRTDLFLRNDLDPTRSEVREYCPSGGAPPCPSGGLKSVTVTAPGTGLPVVTSYENDTLVRLKKMTDPSSGDWIYGYDLNDNRTLEDDPTPGRHLLMAYDALNRVTSRTEIGSTAGRSTTFDYDGPVSYGTGRLYRVTRSQASGAFGHEHAVGGYDARGNVTQSTQRIQAGAGTIRSYVTTKAYDPIGRLVATTLPAPGGHEGLVYSYAPSGEVVAVGSNRNNPAYATDVRYDERGRVTNMGYGNGVSDTFAYHTTDGRNPSGGGGVRAGYGHTLAQITSRHAGRDETLRQLDYATYNLNGQITRVLDGFGGGVFQDAVYDDAARLVEWSAAGISAGAYAYDGLGRLTSKEGKAYTYSAAQPYHIENYDGGTVAYDENGNIKQLPGGKTFEYDAEGNLVKANAAGETQYFSDDGGMRRVKVAPGGHKTFFFDDFDVEIGSETIQRHIRLNGKLVAESSFDGSGVLQTARLTVDDLRRLQGFTGAAALVLVAVCLAVPGRARLGRRRVARRGPAALAALLVVAQWPIWAWAQCTPPPFPDTRLYYHPDHLGSAHLLTNAEGLSESTKYFPYGTVADRRNGSGVPIADTQGAFAFTGHRKAENHGLAYFQARYYAPELGVFMSRDPAGQFPNPYSYADGDPLNLHDPDGRSFLNALGMALWALETLVGVLDAATSTALTTSAPESTSQNDVPQPGDVERRALLADHANSLAGAANEGQITSLEALASVSDYAAALTDDPGTFADDIGQTLAGTTRGNVGSPAGRVPPFGDTGFAQAYRDGGNQVRHFSGALVAGARYGSFTGQALNTGREVLTRGSVQDIRVGNAAARLGADIMAGRIALPEVGPFIRREFGGP